MSDVSSLYLIPPPSTDADPNPNSTHFVWSPSQGDLVMDMAAWGMVATPTHPTHGHGSYPYPWSW